MNSKLLSLLIYLFFLSFSASSQNFLTNGYFENNFTDWSNLASDGGVATYSVETTDIEEGAKAMKVEITILGTNNWSIQTTHNAWPSVNGTEYKLRFYAKALVAGTSVRAVQQVNNYATHDFPLTTVWQAYEWVFKAQENSLELKFHFFQLETIYIDNVTIEPTIPMILLNKDTLKVNTSTLFQTQSSLSLVKAFTQANPEFTTYFSDFVKSNTSN